MSALARRVGCKEPVLRGRKEARSDIVEGVGGGRGIGFTSAVPVKVVGHWGGNLNAISSLVPLHCAVLAVPTRCRVDVYFDADRDVH